MTECLEKPVYGFWACVGNAERAECEECPYKGERDCIDALLRDLRRLISKTGIISKPLAINAKPITADAAADAPANVVFWVEQRYQDETYLEPMVSNGAGLIGNCNMAIAPRNVNPQRFRFWTDRPTDKQRKVVPWNG